MQQLEIDLEEENKEIVRRYRKLMRASKPILNDGDAKIIRKAFKMSVDAHKDMRRKSGEPYIYHPIAVAQICVEEIGLGTTSIVAALLHDTVEDTHLELHDIEREFGPKVAKIIAGLTKISNVVEQGEAGASLQAENFKKILLTLSDDIRVVLIKLADRLHNMRTLDSMSRDKQLKIASETIYLYAPLAHRLGLNVIKTELEDFWLKYTHEEDYKQIAKKLNQTRTARSKFIKDFISPLQRELDKTGYKFKIFGRPKSIFSIYNKTVKQHTPFEKVYDLFAIRIVLDVPFELEKSACWYIYSVVTDFYKPNPDRLRDWVSTPKSNGYESLHTTVMSNSGQWVEVQIRTDRMDQIAEKGYAAHWKYKEQGATASEKGLELWISKVRDALQSYNYDAMEFVDDFRNNLLTEEIFAFTPKGDLKTLPKGATALDFAFEIHTQVGLRCIGAKVNQKLVPLSHQLHNGDQVEILTSNKQKPHEDWLKFVTTSRAKSKIKDSMKEEMKRIAAEGKEIVLRKLDHLKLDLNNDVTNQLLAAFDEKQPIDLFYKVGRGIIDSKEIKRVFTAPKEKPVPLSPDLKDKKTFVKEISKIRGEATDTLLIGENMDRIDYAMSKCCNPIPGDDVFGFVTVSEGIKIHRTTCPNAVELMSNYGYRIVKARWTSQKELAFLAGLKIVGGDRLGMINDITQVISLDIKVNIRSITIDSVDGMFEGKIMVFVEDTVQLQQLVIKLQTIPGIVSVTRYEY